MVAQTQHVEQWGTVLDWFEDFPFPLKLQPDRI